MIKHRSGMVLMGLPEQGRPERDRSWPERNRRRYLLAFALVAAVKLAALAWVVQTLAPGFLG
jgi:hypothetical protein